MRIIVMIIMTLALSGCTSHGIKPAESQTAPSQSETVAVEENTTAEATQAASGCGSVMTGMVAVLALVTLAGGMVAKKKD
jgi:uncharacterized protein YceK